MPMHGYDGEIQFLQLEIKGEQVSDSRLFTRLYFNLSSRQFRVAMETHLCNFNYSPRSSDQKLE